MSDYLDPNNEELLKDFFLEANQQVEVLEQNILAVEDNPEDEEAVDEIFRAAHTLKGGASTVQMTELAEFTHIVEDLLDSIRDKKVTINSDVVDSLLSSIDVIKLILEARQNGEIYEEDLTTLKNELKSFNSQAATAPSAATKVSAPKEVPSVEVSASDNDALQQGGNPPLSEYDMLELKDAAGSTPVYRVIAEFDENNPMNSVGGIQVFAKLKDYTQVLKTYPEFDLLYEDNFFPFVDYYVSTESSIEDIKQRTFIPDVTLRISVISAEQVDSNNQDSVVEVDNAADQNNQSEVSEQVPVQPSIAVSQIDTNSLPEESALEDEKAVVETEDNKLKVPKKTRAKDKNTGSVLRVDSKRIDNLLNLVSEAVINKATFNQISSKFTDLQTELMSAENAYKDKLKMLFDELPYYLEQAQSTDSIKTLKESIFEKYEDVFTSFESFDSRFKSVVTSFKSTAANLGRNTGDLHEAILRIRMVPIAQIFSRFPRLVRDLSKSLDKKVDLIIEGEDTELDKSVIEELLDPLMHCIRNSLDHGIETISERKKLGKPEQGRLLLKASNEGNMIIIEVADDGAGIDVKKVRDKAIQKGVIHPGKNLSDIEAFNLIFDPGFSTAKKITNISGRGVGLDVVKREIEKLNGSVSVWSKHGEGTRFTIKLPLTLAIIQGLLVKVGSEIYAIPITSVIESLRIKPEEINVIDNYEVFNIRNDVISLMRLNDLFNIQTEKRTDHNFVVIVGSGDKKMGLMVDSLIGEEDVVIKPLKDKYTNSPGIAGATILGDGTVSLIIDVSQLLDLGVQLEQKARLATGSLN